MLEEVEVLEPVFKKQLGYGFNHPHDLSHRQILVVALASQPETVVNNLLPLLSLQTHRKPSLLSIA